MKVAPSILTADFLHLEKELKMIDSCSDYLHLDVMDGSFVPNISFGFPVIEAISKVMTIPMDAHLMVVEPQRWFETLARMGVQMVSFHLEATGWKTSSVIKAAKKTGMKVGLAINPNVPVEKLYKYIGKADFFLVMSVFAGFGGQKFIENTISKVKRLRQLIESSSSSALIEVDGGVQADTAPRLVEVGVDVLVSGSYVFKAADPLATISSLRNL